MSLVYIYISDALSDRMKNKVKIGEQFTLKAEGKKRLEQKKQAMKRLNVNWAKGCSVRGEKVMSPKQNKSPNVSRLGQIP